MVAEARCSHAAVTLQQSSLGVWGLAPVSRGEILTCFFPFFFCFFSQVAKAQKNTVVVMVNPGAVLTPWARPAVKQTHKNVFRVSVLCQRPLLTP